MDRMLYKMFVGLSDRHDLMARQITLRMAAQQLTFDAIAKALDITPDQLGRLALCRPPRVDAFEADVQAIALAVPMDAQTLTAWLSKGSITP